MRLSFVIINLTYQIDLESSIWKDLQKDFQMFSYNALKTSQNREHT